MKEIVMGLQWAPTVSPSLDVCVDLDAICILLDDNDRILDVVDPSNPRTTTDSVVHTGDANAGSVAWDGERIFVFLDALPPKVSRIRFCVHCVSGHAIAQASSVRCHLSNARDERVYRRIDLGSLVATSFATVFLLRHQQEGWCLVDPQEFPASDDPPRLPLRHSTPTFKPQSAPLG